MSDYRSTPEVIDARLHPTTSVLGGRYGNRKMSKPSNMVIKPGQFSYAGESEIRYLPLGWSSHVQPEGQLYFSRDSSPRIVTDAYIYCAVIQQKVLSFAAVVAKVLDAKHISLPDSAEVYLWPSDIEDECHYYVVDHTSQTMFWFEEVDLDQLCIPDVVSESHLRAALGDLYWQHVEQFPSHCPVGLSLAVDDLIAIFIHGQGDHMTSANSTFPYVAKECKNFIRILEGAQQRLSQPSSICVVARLWSIISRHRLQTHYAQERARLSRDQLILALPETPRGRVFAATSRLLFGLPEAYAGKLDRLYNDEIVYVQPWREFMGQCREEWQRYLSWSLGLAIINALALALSPLSTAIASISLGCCALGVIAGLVLLLRYDDAHSWCADQAAIFLASAKEASPGFRRAGLAFSAPRAVFVWAALIASAQALYWLQRATNVFVLAAAVAIVLFANLPWTRWVREVRWIVARRRRDREEKGIFQV
ncbi:hypothetical protein C8Q77DRAFT_1062486 [Trametes polyzona]|nr:hypothetical protein C8Q77DRAFT_1062486 [Trametes polyzona]